MTQASPRPLKILLVSSSSGSQGGGELYLVSLAQQLQEFGHDVQVVLSSHSRMDSLAQMLCTSVETHRFDYVSTYDRPLRALGAVTDRRGIARLGAYFREQRPDVIHINKQNVEDGLDLVLAARRSALPFVNTIHITRGMGSLGAVAGRARDAVAQRVLRRTKSPCIAIATNSAGELQEFLGTESPRVHLVLNGVAEPPKGCRNACRTEWGCSEETVVIGCVARIEEQKNPLFLLRLLPQLPDEVHLVWIGDGRLRDSMERTAREFGVHGRVHIDGWRSDARERMAGFDLFALPSAYEGLPLAVLEAMAAGLPCIVSDVDGVGDALIDGETGRLCPPGDPDRWLGCLNRLAMDGRERKRLGARARLRYQQCFTRRAMAQNTVEIYHQVIRQTGLQ